MTKNSHKIKAFTLSEMIIVVLLTVIVAGIAFSVLQLVQKHMYAIQANFSNATSVTLLEQSLWIDANRCNHIKYEEDTSTLYFISEIDTTSYTFEKEYIQKETDTFDVAIADKVFYFKGEETIAAKVDAFKLITAKEFRNTALFIYKRNTANTYMNP
ncbi:hypothetical protein U8527_11255 [Kordia algicida OT-1]|uniref:Prepilin-type N-terminal cleavage/methylation domain-containing protein n=1 Tax=Kordia algicida OT-1 TaxID=391587 RepID=A9CTW7_9FLAO|nr:hypothetical protein [Kordia algicida]EDP94152.1 hypothetical protein KAOT1_04757 [Kordia algicida OT-1]